MNLTKPLLLLALAIQFTTANAQEVELELNRVLDQVKVYHPVVQQADLIVRNRALNIRKQRGSFDPVIYGSIDQKDFQDKEYFKQNDAGLKIPTLYGVEFNGAYSSNRGAFLNPEMYTPGGGVASAGIKVPVGRGLLTDEKRAALRQAKIFGEAAEFERREILNNVIFDCINQYFSWAEAHNQFNVYDFSVVLARDRFQAVKRSFQLGDIPAIDTLESYIQLQNRTLLRAEYELKYLKETRLLSNFIWGDSLVPLTLADSTLPTDLELMQLPLPIAKAQVDSLISNLIYTHPKLVFYDFKQQGLEIDRKLQVEYLKPQLDVKSNLLNEPIAGDPVGGFNPNDFKWGLEFGFPIFMRKARSSIDMTDIKIQDNSIALQAKALELENKLKQYFNAQNILRGQIALYRDAVRNYDRLLAAERQKFDSGESSLFLINSRENMLFSARFKLIELLAKYNRAHYGIYWSAGNLFEEI